MAAALGADASAASMKLPPGFRVEVIAREPDVVQPIAYTLDDRGRLWVLECKNNPESPGVAKDKVAVIEDSDGDGGFEKRTVFRDKATSARPPTPSWWRCRFTRTIGRCATHGGCFRSAGRSPMPLRIQMPW